MACAVIHTLLILTFLAAPGAEAIDAVLFMGTPRCANLDDLQVWKCLGGMVCSDLNIIIRADCPASFPLL